MHFPRFIFIALCYTLGTMLGVRFLNTGIIISAPVIFGTCCVVLFFIFSIYFITPHWSSIIQLCFIIGAGFFFSTNLAQSVQQNKIPQRLEGVPCMITGTILDIPETTNQNSHFEFLIQDYKPITQNIDVPHWSMPEKIRLSWYASRDVPLPSLISGERWRFAVRLKQARSTFNPESFDYERWLFFHKITAVGSITHQIEPLKLAEAQWVFSLEHTRMKIAQAIEHTLHDAPPKGMIEALAVGLRTHLTAEQWRIMQATGTNHLVAIAGLHIGFVFSFSYVAIKFLWRQIPWLMLWRPAHEAAIVMALLAAFYYSALAGFALPTERALIMLSITLLASVLRKNIPRWHSLSMALLVALLLDPLCIYSESFWLSFVAVTIIIFSMNTQKSHQHWRGLLRAQWIVTFGLAPITLYFFHQVSVINIIANSIVIPWVGFIALPLIVSGCFLLPFSPKGSAFLWQSAAKILHFYWPCLQFFSRMNRLQWHAYLPTVWILLWAMLGVLLRLSAKQVPCRAVGILGFLPLVFISVNPIAPNTFKMTQLDVGQGLSTLIQTAHHTLVFDTGPRFDDAYDMGASVVVPALFAAQINHLDTLIISHADNDHSGGAWAVLNALPVNHLLTSAQELYASLPTQLPQQQALPNWLRGLQKTWPAPSVQKCTAGQQWQWDGVWFTMLSPNPNHQSRTTNNRSCVLRINNTFHSVLLTADIETPTEKNLLMDNQTNAQALAAEILVAPHHGSKTSSSEAFIDAVHPHWVFYATGYRNRFHFPSSQIVARYRAHHVGSMNTADVGQIIVDAPDHAGGLQVIGLRPHAPPGCACPGNSG